MKGSQFYKSITLLLLFIVTTVVVQAQDISLLGDNRCYVVVGAFKLEKNATRFANSLMPKGYDAKHKYNSRRQLHYVYTYQSADREAAKSKLFAIREKFSGMTDSWLYAGNFNGPHITSEEWAAMLAQPKKSTVKRETSEDIVKETMQSEEPVAEKKAVADVPEPVEEEVLQPGTFKVYINTTYASNQSEISVDFKVLDIERNKELTPVKSHELLKIKPNNGSNRIKLVSNTIGYKLAEHVIDLDEPLEESNSRVEVKGDTILIDFEMAKYSKGEFAVLWQVFFYRDAAIMREESVYELNQLLAMMKDDDNMKIRIHGHTNGNSHGKVLHLDLDDKQFFSLNGSHNEDNASARKLSEYRAYTIQHWLMDQGIAEERMEIIGWGGKKMIYDKHDDKANQNVRVEIEVLETS